MFKKLFFSILLLMCPCIIYSDDGDNLYYYSKTSTSPEKISLDKLDKITFSKDCITLWYEKGSEDISYDDFFMFTFAQFGQPLSVSDIPMSHQDDVFVRYVASVRTLYIEGNRQLIGVHIYDLKGQIVYVESSPSVLYSINLSSVPSGIYLVKTICGGKTYVKKIIL